MRRSHVGLLLRFSFTVATYSPGLSAAITDDPSVPTQRPKLNGMPTAEPQVSFCVENPLSPEWTKIEGMDAGKPKQSGTMYSLLDLPNSFRKNLFP